MWCHWHEASYHPLRANVRRRRCMASLTSESPLVHSTQITQAAGSELDRHSRAEKLTDGSPQSRTATRLPAMLDRERPPTVRTPWLLLNMKCRSVGMSRLSRSEMSPRLILWCERWAHVHSLIVTSSSWWIVLLCHLKKLIFTITNLWHPCVFAT